MADSEDITIHDLAQKIGASIADLLENASQFNGTTRSRMILDAAQAYRALRGGPQPGSVTVEK